MIEALKSDDLVYKVGGRFKLTALVQKRWEELLEGARPLVERRPGMTDMEVVVQEILQDKITIDYDNSDIPRPEEIIRLPGKETPAAKRSRP
jgi:DNA-directed RNA polymerase subunit omega